MTTLLGMLGLCFSLCLFIYWSIIGLLIGLGKKKNLITGNYSKSRGDIVKGIIGLLVTVPFFLFIVFIIIMGLK